MPALSNGQCAHRQVDFGRCLNLAITVRAIELFAGVMYDIPLCEHHAEFYDKSSFLSIMPSF